MVRFFMSRKLATIWSQFGVQPPDSFYKVLKSERFYFYFYLMFDSKWATRG